MKHKILVSLFSALLAIVLTTESALMAIVSVDDVCGGLNDTLNIGYTYNDQNLAVQNIKINNNSGGTASITVTILDDAGNIIAATQNGINANQPQITVNLQPYNLTMVERTGPHGTSLQFPGRISCSITPGR